WWKWALEFVEPGDALLLVSECLVQGEPVRAGAGLVSRSVCISKSYELRTGRRVGCDELGDAGEQERVAYAMPGRVAGIRPEPDALLRCPLVRARSEGCKRVLIASEEVHASILADSYGSRGWRYRARAKRSSQSSPSYSTATPVPSWRTTEQRRVSTRSS